ncbi:rare lipoprotein A [Humitalea rosea]|uniref:Endolytic peptidoglycan transglycosylase RlpA n=1 Tax=Humitalea rosea TaxID=990373 RepID=A0A2W7JF14_9PROT|nr:RlpA-like double-psi beta-barrel domain-containing protein [Humitalea rosea]PZW51077.1 rare lipoprotein A [Humitalea rosea]
MRLGIGAALAAVVLLSGCARRPAPPAPSARYLIGAPYSAGGVWSYPAENFSLVETGLASIIPDPRAGRLTANGERYDPAALMAAHRTLQMPAILRVTNLDAGLELLVRVNDRGPVNPGRVLSLSPRAASLLQAGQGTRLRIAVEAEASRAIATGLPAPEAVPLAIAAAPSGTVEREALALTPGARQSDRLRQGRPAAAVVAAPIAAAPVNISLPQQARSVPANPGQILVEAGRFTGRDAAARQAARIGGARVERFGSGRAAEYRVRLGPLHSAAEADAALERVLGTGISGARIIVD